MYNEYPLMDQNEALARLGGMTALYKKLLAKFTVEPYLTDLHAAAAAAGDFAAAREPAHALKGVAANLALVRLHKATTDIEGAFKDGNDPGADLLAALDTICADTIAAVAAF